MIYACADGMFEHERKMQYLQTRRWNVVKNESSRDFGPCDRFWTQLALRCFLQPTSPLGTALREGLSAPKPYETNPTPTHSSRPQLSLQFQATFPSLMYSRQNSFSLSYCKHWSRAIQSVRTRPAKGNTHTQV